MEAESNNHGITMKVVNKPREVLVTISGRAVPADGDVDLVKSHPVRLKIGLPNQRWGYSNALNLVVNPNGGEDASKIAMRFASKINESRSPFQATVESTFSDNVSKLVITAR